MNCADSQRWILRRIWASVQRALGLLKSTERRRRYCKTLATPVVTLCSCSPKKEAEYLTTQRYSLRSQVFGLFFGRTTAQCDDRCRQGLAISAAPLSGFE